MFQNKLFTQSRNPITAASVMTFGICNIAITMELQTPVQPNCN